MVKPAALVTAAALFASAEAGGQATGSIRGVVRDSAAAPVPNVDVVVLPTGRHLRSDSAGRFAFDALDGGKYTVRARRFGFGPGEWSVDLAKGGRVDVQLVLGARIAALDTVFVVDGRPCERDTFAGFMCRRATAKGRFMDYTDVDSMNVHYSADILRDIAGFRTVVYPTKAGPTRVGDATRCTIVLLNGVPVPWSTVPESPYAIIGVEIYQNPREIPKEFRRYTWGKEQCWLVAYWSANFLKPVTKVALPRPRD